jgi:hypothetical protein
MRPRFQFKTHLEHGTPNPAFRPCGPTTGLAKIERTVQEAFVDAGSPGVGKRWYGKSKSGFKVTGFPKNPGDPAFDVFSAWPDIPYVATMLPVTFTESHNGYPVIQLNSPFELFGEFLCAEHSMPKARRTLDTVDSVLAGRSNHEELWQDYAKLTLDRNTMTANVWFDNLSKGTVETSDMPLLQFREVAAAWLDYLENRARSSG